jgi:glycosyltransferase involved in cell wall biosynthesis
MAWYIPGMGYQENILPSEQSKLGHNVEIITSNRIPDFGGLDQVLSGSSRSGIQSIGTFEENGIRIHRLPCLESAGQVYLVGLRSKLKTMRPDIVQSHGAFSPSTVQTILYSKGLGYRLFIDDHSHKTNFHANDPVRRSYITLLRAVYRITDERIECYMPITNSARDILKSTLHIPTKKIEPFPLGADTGRFTKSAQLRESGRSTYGIQDGTRVIVTAGKFAENKDVDVLIKAFGQVIKGSPNVALLLVGNGPREYMSRLKKLADEITPSGKVRFIDFVRNADLPMIFNSSDIGVWPGNVSITVVEALATGLPTILQTDDSGAYEMILRERAAVGFDRGSVDSLAGRIEELLEEPELRAKIGTRAESLVDDSLSWRRIAEKSIFLYRR